MSDLLIRDDDPNVYTDAHLFRELHEQFIARGVEHTAAVLMKDLWQNHALFWYLATAPLLNIGLHGWEHKDYSQLPYVDCAVAIMDSLRYWNDNATRMVGYAKPITTFFAPWNRSSEQIREACANYGLKFCDVHSGEWEGRTVRSFHWWNVMNRNFSVDALLA